MWNMDHGMFNACKKNRKDLCVEIEGWSSYFVWKMESVCVEYGMCGQGGQWNVKACGK